MPNGLLNTMTLAIRRTSLLKHSRKRRTLKRSLEAIGVDTTEDITRDHIRRAHRIFRGARGQQEINDLWTFIKQFICPRCDGIKWRPKGQYCGSWCSQKNKRNNFDNRKSKQ